MPRQTYTYLRKLFDKNGVGPRRQFGQNFLIDLNIHDLILATAELGPNDVVLEVGPGAGAMTRLMAETGATIVAVEIDPILARLAREAVEGHPGVVVLHQDALANKNKMAPEPIDAVRAGLRARANGSFKLVANLPYNVATPIVSNLLVMDSPRAERMVVTIQLELARRMLAVPSTPDYSALSVLVQALADVELVRELAPSVFWPRPNVNSAVLAIRPVPERREAIGDVAWFQFLVRQVFTLRRKNLRRSLHGFYRDRLDKDQIEAVLVSVGLTAESRAEALDVAQHIALAKAMRAAMPEAPVPPPSPEEDQE